jgi:hypothetical protein
MPTRDEFIDIVTMEKMEMPYVASDGLSYNLETLKRLYDLMQAGTVFRHPLDYSVPVLANLALLQCINMQEKHEKRPPFPLPYSTNLYLAGPPTLREQEKYQNKLPMRDQVLPFFAAPNGFYPASLCDHLTHQPLTNPYIASDGWTYNRDTLQMLLRSSAHINEIDFRMPCVFNYNIWKLVKIYNVSKGVQPPDASAPESTAWYVGGRPVAEYQLFFRMIARMQRNQIQERDDEAIRVAYGVPIPVEREINIPYFASAGQTRRQSKSRDSEESNILAQEIPNMTQRKRAIAAAWPVSPYSTNQIMRMLDENVATLESPTSTGANYNLVPGQQFRKTSERFYEGEKFVLIHNYPIYGAVTAMPEFLVPYASRPIPAPRVPALLAPRSNIRVTRTMQGGSQGRAPHLTRNDHTYDSDRYGDDVD